MFLEANYAQVDVLNDVLENFCKSSGAKVSKQKTQIFFSKNVPVTLASGICKALAFSITNNLGRYLSMPLLHDRVPKKTYQSIIDKIDQRLSGRAAKHLSLAWRVTLAQSMLQAILIYALQTTHLPTSAKVKIGQLFRRFIWSGAGSQRKLSLVNWNNICRPKSNGGLGFKDMEIMNKALLMKVAWDVFINPSKLCSQVLISKYVVPSDMPITNVPTKNGSYLWRSIGKIWKDFQKGLHWSIGNGQRVKFWDDIWVINGDPLINYTVASISDSMRNMLVAECVDQNGNWLWNIFSSLLNNRVVLRIASMAPPSTTRSDDRMYWGASNTGIFTIQSVFHVLMNLSPVEDSQDWRHLLCHDRLKTGYELARRHLDIDPLCGRCHVEVESSLHAIQDCAYSIGVWRKLVLVPRQHAFFSYPHQKWIMMNLMRRSYNMGSLYWYVMFGVAAWRIWF